MGKEPLAGARGWDGSRDRKGAVSVERGRR
jgi:hypothetical protein